MEELSYEPAGGRDGRDARWLARAIAGGTLLMAAVEGGRTSLVFWTMVDRYGFGPVRTEVRSVEGVAYALVVLALPLAVATGVVWLLSRRPPAILLAATAAILSLGGTIQFGDWWYGLGFVAALDTEHLGQFLAGWLLALLFLSPAFRRAARAPAG